ncbi:MAG: pitrilysin family protein, partial [Pseudomonadota bacterium]
LLRRAITAPSFDPVPMERVRGQYLASIEQDMQSPGYLAGRKLSEMGFKGHPYANPVDGTLETIRTMTRDDLIAAKERVMTKDHVVVSAVGDITAEELGLVIDRMIGDLPDTGAPLPGKVSFGAPGGITIIDIPSPQSTAIWAQDTIGFGDPDFMVAYVMNHILGGGGFGSRLTTEVREKRGLTYGVYSYFAFLANANYLGGSVASANGTIAEALDVIRAEWQRMAIEGVTPEELERAQKNLTGAYALRFDGNAEIAGILQSMQIDNFPTNYVNIRNDLVRAVTVEDVKRVAKRMLDTDALRFVVVGRPEGLTATE